MLSPNFKKLKSTDCLVLWLPTAVLLLANGCRPQDKITTYRLDKSPPSEAVDVDRLAEQQDRMLAAVVPEGNKAWFFKLVGPLAVIDRHRDEFLQLLGSLKLNTDTHPGWQAPAGWQEKPASGMRAATFAIADPSGPLELSVTSLPLHGDWEEYVAMNVNRWLNQLQQSPLKKEDILKLIKTVPIGKSSTEAPQKGKPSSPQATWVELVGTMARNKGGANSGMGKPARGGLPAGHPPIGSASQAADSQAAGGQPHSAAGAPFTYQKPADWLPGRVGGMRKAAFRLVDGEKQAEVTVIDLPSRGASGISDVAANVRRWAAQVGLQDLADKQLAELTRPIEIDGNTGQMVALLGPKTSGKGLLAAMMERQGWVWFFKLSGDRSLVESQRKTFTKFLKSVKFK